MAELTDKDCEALRKMFDFENTHPKEEFDLGWEWHQVSVMQATINKFITMDLVKRTFSSRSTKAHELTEKGRAIAEQRTLVPNEPVSVPVGDLDFDSMFSDIVGYNNLKELLRECLQVEKPIHVMLVGPPALAKSVDGSTRVTVMTTHGVEIIPISEVYKRYCSGEQFMAASVNRTTLRCEFKSVYAVTKHEVKSGEMIKVKTRTGRELMATRDHSFLEYRDGKLLPVSASELKLGSLVPILYNIEPESLKGPELCDDAIYTYAYELTREFGFALGVWLSEGSLNYYSGARVTFAVFDSQLEKVLIEVLHSSGFANALKVVDSVEVRNKEFVEFVEHFLAGGAGKLKKKGTYALFKKIPSWVFSTPLDFREGVVAGYFQGDGGSSNTYGAYLGTSSHWLFDGMMFLLTTLGIATTSLDSYISGSGNMTYRYRIASEHKDKFKSLLSRSPYCSKIDRLIASSQFSNMYIPVDTELYKGLHSPGITSRKLPYRRILEKFQVRTKAGGRISFPYAERLLAWDGEKGKLWDRLTTLLNADVFWAPITSIEECNSADAYDLSVQDNENFLTSEGFLTHNTLFLWDIERVWGEQAMWLVGSATSRAGLWDIVAEKRPRILLIDELDKMTLTDTAALLSLMEKGRLVRMKVNRRLDLEIDVWVVACANRIYKMSPELLSRFKVYQINEYNASEFREVVTSALVTHEGVTKDEAAEIATRLVGKTHDVRDAIRVARLTKKIGVTRAVELLIG